MRLFQPLPNDDSPLKVPKANKVPCPVPLWFIKHRYGHHAAASGYSRICDYIDAETIRVSRPLHLLGETILRPFALLYAKNSGHFEYSRYDFVKEIAAISKYVNCKGGIFHFIYAEKNYSLMKFLQRNKKNIVVGTVHHPSEHQEWLFRDNSHMRTIDMLITMDKKTVNYWQNLTGRDNVKWLPNGVDTNYFSYVGKNRNRPYTVVFAGSHERDFEALSSVVQQISSSQLDIEFDLIGSNSTLGQLAAAYENVKHHENLPDQRYREIFQSADLLFLPLRASTFCNVALEAMACGMPVVTNHGGLVAYLSEECAYMLPVGDVRGMRDAILRQVGKAPGERLSRQSARAQSMKFSFEKVAKLHVECYESLMMQSNWAAA